MNKLVLVLLGSSIAFNATAAATIASIQGKGNVLVNQGEEFRPASNGMQLKPGDRVMVQEGSEARLKFDDDCAYSVGENKIITIPERSPCAGGTVVAQELNPAGGNAIGGGSTGTGNGGVAIMAAVVTAIDLWWLNEDDSDIVSP